MAIKSNKREGQRFSFLCSFFLLILYIILCGNSCGNSKPSKKTVSEEKRVVEDYEVLHDLNEWEGKGILAIRIQEEKGGTRIQVVMIDPEGEREMVLFQAQELNDLYSISGNLAISREKNLIIFAAEEKEYILVTIWKFQDKKIEKLNLKGEIDLSRNSFSLTPDAKKILLGCDTWRLQTYSPEKMHDSTISICQLDIFGDNVEKEVFYDPSLELVVPKVHPIDKNKVLTHTITDITAQGYTEHAYLLDLTKKSAKNLINYALSPDWSPKGNYISFFRHNEGTGVEQVMNDDLWVANADGTEEKKLTDTARAWTVAWSASEKHIFFAQKETESGEWNSKKLYSDIWQINRDGTGLKKITNSPKGTFYYIYWAGE